MVNDIHRLEGMLTCDDGVCLEWVTVHLHKLEVIDSYEYYQCLRCAWGQVIKICGDWNLMIDTKSLCFMTANKVEIIIL